MSGPWLLGRAPSTFGAEGAGWTAREIAQQPAIWRTLPALVAAADGLDAWLAARVADPRLRIVLTGAGTSAFIGECLAPYLAAHTQRRVEAIATTDLVSGPTLYLQRDVPTLLVSFARSGSSPESVAAVDLADACVDDVAHLVVTCNADGALYRRFAARGDGGASPAAGDGRVLLLPAATHDRAFAMTSSFSGMLLAAALAFGLGPRDAAAADALAQAGDAMLARSAALSAPHGVPASLERVVYLGSNGLRGLAREAALKLLELTDGRVVGASDSALGFRHGPKTILNARTLVVMFVSTDAHTRRYDLDLLRQLRAEARCAAVWAVGGPAAFDDAQASDAARDFVVPLPDAAGDLVFALGAVVLAQALALQQSLAHGITPDNPSASGTVTRVVSGVTIHPLPATAAREGAATHVPRH